MTGVCHGMLITRVFGHSTILGYCEKEGMPFVSNCRLEATHRVGRNQVNNVER